MAWGPKTSCFKIVFPSMSYKTKSPGSGEL